MAGVLIKGKFEHRDRHTQEEVKMEDEDREQGGAGKGWQRQRLPLKPQKQEHEAWDRFPYTAPRRHHSHLHLKSLASRTMRQ